MRIFQIISREPVLRQVLPAAIIFTVLSILGTTYNSYYDILQLRDIYMQEYRHDDFARELANRLAKRTVVKLKAEGRVSDDLHVNTLQDHLLLQISDASHYDTVVNLEYANR